MAQNPRKKVDRVCAHARVREGVFPGENIETSTPYLSILLKR